MYAKAFIAGLAVPAFFLSLLLSISAWFGKLNLYSWDILLGPIIYGTWNILYVAIKEKYPVKNKPMRFGIHGSILGFLFVASFFLYPEAHQEMSGSISALSKSVNVNFLFHGLSLVWVPIVYYLIWRYLIYPINELLGVKI